MPSFSKRGPGPIHWNEGEAVDAGLARLTFSSEVFLARFGNPGPGSGSTAARPCPPWRPWWRPWRRGRRRRRAAGPWRSETLEPFRGAAAPGTHTLSDPTHTQTHTRTDTQTGTRTEAPQFLPPFDQSAFRLPRRASPHSAEAVPSRG